jgi:predicted DNA-binding WGR domain protein
MSAVTLHRIDAARHMSRFYRLDVQPDLFGQWCFMREWGPHRPRQTNARDALPNTLQAEAALERQRRVKERRTTRFSRHAESRESGGVNFR